jgi:hypothetical protein
MIFWIITALPFTLLLVFLIMDLIENKGKIDGDGWEAIFAGLGIGLVMTAIVSFISGLVLSVFSYGFSDFKKIDEVTYTISEKSPIVMNGSDIEVIIEENGSLREFEIDADETFFREGEKDTIYIETWERTAPLWVPWGTGTPEFVTITKGK